MYACQAPFLETQFVFFRKNKWIIGIGKQQENFILFGGNAKND